MPGVILAAGAFDGDGQVSYVADVTALERRGDRRRIRAREMAARRARPLYPHIRSGLAASPFRKLDCRWRYPLPLVRYHKSQVSRTGSPVQPQNPRENCGLVSIAGPGFASLAVQVPVKPKVTVPRSGRIALYGSLEAVTCWPF